MPYWRIFRRLLLYSTFSGALAWPIYAVYLFLIENSLPGIGVLLFSPIFGPIFSLVAIFIGSFICQKLIEAKVSNIFAYISAAGFTSVIVIGLEFSAMGNLQAMGLNLLVYLFVAGRVAGVFIYRFLKKNNCFS